MTERVVLWPTDETLYAEICLAASKDPGKWSDLDALTYEANHLVSITWLQAFTILLNTVLTHVQVKKEPDLILDPDPLISRVANATLAVSSPLPYSFKRKREAVDTAQQEEEKVQRAKTMNLMNPRADKPFVPECVTSR